MKGKELFTHYIQKRDEYARVLLAAYNNVGEEIFPMLEKAEATQKKIILTHPDIDTFSEPVPIIQE